MSVPLLGEADPLIFSGEDVAKLWDRGTLLSATLPDAEFRTFTLPGKHVRRSDNGLWVIRQYLRPDASAESISEIAVKEYGRLAQLGLNILIFASVPAADNKKLFTITPWLEDLALCRDELYEAAVAPVLEAYTKEVSTLRRQGSLTLDIDDLMVAHQHSEVGEPIVPVLHDVDPRLVPGFAI